MAKVSEDEVLLLWRAISSSFKEVEPGKGTSPGRQDRGAAERVIADAFARAAVRSTLPPTCNPFGVGPWAPSQR